jgi:hypothetical protein
MRTLLLIFFALSLPSFVGAQAQKISGDEYFSNLERATKITEAMFPRRSVRIQEEFTDGKRSVRKTSTFDYAASDRNRKFVEIGGRSTAEYIQVGQQYFCKSESARWKKSNTKCEPTNMSMSPDPDFQEFTMEEASGNQGEKVFRWYKTWVYPKPNGVEYFTEQIFTVRSDGAFVRINIRDGRTRSKQPDSVQTDTYEYNISDLKIEPPVK